MDKNEYTKNIRSIIEHEDTLRDQRLTWLLVFQGLLVAALASVQDQPGENQSLIFWLPRMGVISCLLIWLFGIIPTGIAIRRLRKNLDKVIQNQDSNIQENYVNFLHLAKGMSSKDILDDINNRKLGIILEDSSNSKWTFICRCLYPWNSLPILLFVFWGTILRG